MKKVILSSAILLASVAGAFAQTAAGNIAIGGTLGFTSTGGKTKTDGNSVDKGNSSSFTIMPNVSYFISDKFAIGLGIGYGSTSAKTPNTLGTATINTKSSNSGFTVNPFAKYFISTGDKSAFFLKGGVDLFFGNKKTQSPNATYTAAVDDEPRKNTTIGFGITPGFLFFPAENFGVELALGGNLLGYSSSTDKYNSKNPVTNDKVEVKETTNTLELLGVDGMGVGVSVYYFIK